MLLFKIDGEGFFVEDVFVEDKTIQDENYILPSDCVTTQPIGFYKPKWTGERWVEGKTDEEFIEDEFLSSLQPSQSELNKAERELEVVELLIEMGLI